MTTGRVETAKFQQVLKNSEFSPGVIDGKFGPKSLLAMNKYQESRRIAPTPRPDQWTVTRLNSESIKRAYEGREYLPDGELLREGIMINYDTLDKEVTAYKAEWQREQAEGTLPRDEVEPPPDVFAPPEKKGLPWWGWMLIGVGAIAVVGGGIYVYYRWMKRPRKREVKQLPEKATATYGETSDLSWG